MVEPTEVVIPLVAIAFSFVLVTTAGGVDLDGSQAKNLYCDIPFFSDSGACETIDTGDQFYKAEFDITLGRLDVQQMDVTTTTEDKDHLSALTSDLSALAFPAETTDSKLEMVLRDSNGRVVASDTERFGTIVGDTRESTEFVAGNLESGSYKLYLQYSGNDCGLITCTDIFETTEVDLQIPQLPLGEAKSFNLVTE